MDAQYPQTRLPLSSLLAQYLTTRSRNPTSSPPELFLSIPSIDYRNIYCPSCSLPRPCLCAISSIPSSYLDFSPSNTDAPVNSTVDDFDISPYISAPELSTHSTPSMSFSASTSSSPTRNDTRNGEMAAERDEWSHAVRDRRRRSGVMSPEEARESASLLNTPEFQNASRKEKEQLIACYQKRQQQNRNSQRNYRRRQAELVDTLREEIERLKKENCRLMDEVLGREKRGKSGGRRRKRVVKEMEVKEMEIKVVEHESHGDGNADMDEE